MKKNSPLGGKIKKARRDAGLSQKQLASLLSVTDKAVSAYEVGRAQPPVQTLRDIAKATYKPTEYFLEEENPVEMTVTDRIAQIEHELMEIKKMLVSEQLQKKV